MLKKIGQALLCISFLGGCGSDKDVTQVSQSIDQPVYKIALVSDFDQSNELDCVKLSELDLKSGFIHASCKNQIESTLKKFFKGQPKVLALELDLEALQESGIRLVAECNKAGGRVFPHLYGEKKIPLKAVKNVIEYQVVEDGEWKEVASEEE